MEFAFVQYRDVTALSDVGEKSLFCVFVIWSFWLKDHSGWLKESTHVDVKARTMYALDNSSSEMEISQVVRSDTAGHPTTAELHGFTIGPMGIASIPTARSDF